jgi:hypothetical protein
MRQQEVIALLGLGSGANGRASDPLGPADASRGRPSGGREGRA